MPPSPVLAGLPAGLSLVDLGNWLLEHPDEIAPLASAGPPGTMETFEAAVDAALAARPRTVVEPWRSDPAALAHHLTGGAYTLWSHIRFLSAKFVEAAEGRDVRQLWNLPSQVGKTTLIMRCIIWALDRDPTLRIMYVSYDADKAVREAGEALDFAREHREFLRFDLRPDIQARGRWNTRQGGGLYATGVGGSIVGYPSNLMWGDDLLGGWVDAQSARIRETTWNIYKSQMRMRMQSHTDPILLCGTRWAELDPTGMALAEQGLDVQPWTLVRIPHIAEAPDLNNPIPEMRLPDPLGRAPGVPLERFSLEEVLARARSLGTHLSAGLEQQRPAPEEGGELKRAWWKWTTALPPAWDDFATSWDVSFKDKDTSDFVVGQAWGRTGGDFWMAEQLRGQWGMGMTKLAVALLAVRHPYATRHYIENTGNGPEVMEELRAGQKDYVITDEQAGAHGMTEPERDAVQALIRHGVPGLLPVNPKGSKSVRVRAEAGLLEAGNCHLLMNDPGALYLVEEAASFPNGQHDDACLAAETEVLTPVGAVPIATLRRGDVVLGSSGWVNVLDAGQTGVRPVLERFGLRATADHPVLTENGWAPFQSLSSTSTLWTCVAGSNGASERSPSSPPGSVCAATSGSGTASAASSSARLGSTPQARGSAQDARLRDATEPMSARGTAASTPPSERRNQAASESMSSCSTASPSAGIPTPDRWPIGATTSPAARTSPPASRLSTRRFGRRTTAAGRSRRAGTFTTPITTTATIARRIWSAFRRATTTPSTMTSRSNATGARSNSPIWTGYGLVLPPGTARPRAASGTFNTPSTWSSGSTAGEEASPRSPEPVFNLRTTDGTFYANGILVHNCDAWSQAMSKLRRSGATVQASSGQVTGARASATPPQSSRRSSVSTLGGPPALGRFARGPR